MHIGVKLGFEVIHQLFSLITVIYFLHFYFKTVFITADFFYFNNWL